MKAISLISSHLGHRFQCTQRPFLCITVWLVALLLLSGCRTTKNLEAETSTSSDDMGRIGDATTSVAAAASRAKEVARTEELNILLRQLGETLDTSSERLFLAFKATNWRLRHQPECLDQLFSQIAKLDTTYMDLGEAHRLSRTQAQELQSHDFESKSHYQFRNQLRRLNEAAHSLELSLNSYLQQTMSPQTHCKSS